MSFISGSSSVHVQAYSPKYSISNRYPVTILFYDPVVSFV